MTTQRFGIVFGGHAESVGQARKHWPLMVG